MPSQGPLAWEIIGIELLQYLLVDLDVIEVDREDCVALKHAQYRVPVDFVNLELVAYCFVDVSKLDQVQLSVCSVYSATVRISELTLLGISIVPHTRFLGKAEGALIILEDMLPEDV
jgi:hypothetical protein